jgi:hypothetical protein
MHEVAPPLVFGQEVGHELLGTGQGLHRAHLREGGRALRAVRDEGRAGVTEARGPSTQPMRQPVMQ